MIAGSATVSPWHRAYFWRVMCRSELERISGSEASVHQGRYVGDAAMVGMAAVVTRDIPPYAKAYGSPARVVGANVIGMRRSSIADTVIADLSHLFESADWSEGVIAFSNAVGLENAIDAWRTRHHPAVAADA